MVYMSCIAKASLKYVWPSWLVHNQNFWQEAASNSLQPWARVDQSIYVESFTGQGSHTAIVTGFMKTGPNRTRTEIHFIAYIKVTLEHCPDVPSTWLKMAKSAFKEGFLPTL